MEKSNFQFSQPYITETIFALNEGFKADQGGQLNMKSVVSVCEPEIHKDDRTAATGIIVNIGEASSKYPFHIKLEMKAEFRWTEDIDKDVESLLKVNAPSLLVGYARPIISMLTSNSPYPTYNLPFINFTSDNKE